MRQLILGGVRSGKSALAERLATDSGGEVVYVATAGAHDDEMRRRIEAHRHRRPQHWLTVEEPLHLAAVLGEFARGDRIVLVDCISLWLTNLLLRDDEAFMQAQTLALLQTLPALPGRCILVSNETGLGITPLGELSRRFADEAGIMNQRLAVCCDQVIMVMAGLPLVLKGESL